MVVNHGGSRVGAGRKKSQQPTVVKRIPVALLPMLAPLLATYKSASSLPAQAQPAMANAPALAIPVFADKVQAGFPSPAEPYIANYMDFNAYLVRNTAATFAVYADGDSMLNAGISAGDLLVVDRSINAKHKDIVLAEVDNAFTVKRYKVTPTGIALHPENPSGKYPIISPSEHSEIRLVGVVTHIIKKV